MNFGHVVIDKKGIKCSCGRQGCLERYCSMVALKEKVRERKNAVHISGKELYEILENDIESIRDIVEEYIENLGLRSSKLYKYI